MTDSIWNVILNNNIGESFNSFVIYTLSKTQSSSLRFTKHFRKCTFQNGNTNCQTWKTISEKTSFSSLLSSHVSSHRFIFVTFYYILKFIFRLNSHTCLWFIQIFPETDFDRSDQLKPFKVLLTNKKGSALFVLLFAHKQEYVSRLWWIFYPLGKKQVFWKITLFPFANLEWTMFRVVRIEGVDEMMHRTFAKFVNWQIKGYIYISAVLMLLMGK